MSAVVFLGPSLRRSSAGQHIDAHFLPPARRGDAYRAVRELRPRVLVLVDGVFQEEPSVWHRELLWAMSEGVHVVGGASMGALRAAELAAYGMHGVGAIFDAYMAGRFAPFHDAFDDDSEVAVAHGPAELGSMPLTVALADMRHALAGAMARGELDDPAARIALDATRDIFFAERTPQRLLSALRGLGFAPLLCEALLASATGEANALKARDAVATLRAGAERARAGGPAFQPGFVFERTLVWENFRRRAASVDAMRTLRTIGATGGTT